jgi:xylulokinase
MFFLWKSVIFWALLMPLDSRCQGFGSTTTPQPSLGRGVPQFVGFDLGTSGARISIIEPNTSDGVSNAYHEVYSQAITWKDCGSYDDPGAWMKAVSTLFQSASGILPNGLKAVSSICVSGTSASCCVVDRNTRTVTRRPRMYDYDVLSSASQGKESFGQQALDCIESHVPPRHTARARTGSLAKLLAWAFESPWKESEVLCHQSDFVSMMLMEEPRLVKSDWHNCLKLGYDVRNKCWPGWMKGCLQDAGISSALDKDIGAIPVTVVSPGAPLGTISKRMAKTLGLPEDTILVGGTTDSNAAFFAAAGVEQSFGTAVTSLGSTTAIKLLSRQYVEDADRGVYSHRFPSFDNGDCRCHSDDDEAWLVGGASNVGCAIFRALNFSNAELEDLSVQIDPMEDSSLEYYPLVKPGERFPVANGKKEPVLSPVPESRKEYLHGLLQSIARIEKEGFKVLKDLGAPLPSVVWTCGGGSKNNVWSQMRQRILSQGLGVPQMKVLRAENTEASFGSALLAAASIMSTISTKHETNSMP